MRLPQEVKAGLAEVALERLAVFTGDDRRISASSSGGHLKARYEWRAGDDLECAGRQWPDASGIPVRPL